MIGTKSSEIFEINEKTAGVNRLINGHSDGAIWGLSTHPNKDIFATVCNDGLLIFLFSCIDCSIN